MPKHVEQRGLRSAEIEVIDDMKNADHRGRACKEGFDVCAVVVPLAHEARAFLLRRSQRSPGSSIPAASCDEPFEVARRAERPPESLRNIPSGSTARERMAA